MYTRMAISVFTCIQIFWCFYCLSMKSMCVIYHPKTEKTPRVPNEMSSPVHIHIHMLTRFSARSSSDSAAVTPRAEPDREVRVNVSVCVCEGGSGLMFLCI